MVVNTWDGAANSNWDDAGNWNSTGITDRIPTASDVVIIPDTSSINNPTLRQNQPCASFDMQANATVVGAGFKITVHEEDSNVAVDNDAIISGVLDLEIQTAGATTLDLMGTSGNFRNLTINHASCDAFLIANTTIDGNLTINLGKLTCATDGGSARTLTVAGTATLGPDSGAADQATLTATSQDLLLGSGKTDGAGLHVKQGGTFVGGSGVHTMGSIVVDNNAAAKFTNTSGTCTINGHSNDSTRSILIAANSVCVAAGTMDLTYGTASNIQCGNAAGINNLTLTGNVTYTQSDSLLMTGNLTVTGSTTLTTSGSNYALTVTEHVIAEGTLTGNASTITIGSLKITSGGTYSATSGTTFILSELSSSGFAFDSHSSGTFTHNNGTVSIGNGTTAAETHLMENTFYNLIINSNADAKLVVFRPKSGSTVTVANDLTMTRGVLYRNNVSDTFTVTGDVSVTSGSTLGRTNDTGASNFGSLWIDAGGTCIASEGVTSITSAKSNFAISNSGTFTHNDGTVTIGPDASNQWLNNGPYYNLISANSSTLGMGISANVTVANDLTINASKKLGFVSAQYNLTVTGDATINGTFTTTTLPTGSHSFGSLTIPSGGAFTATSGTTTLTDEVGTYALDANDGTFTHNNGKVKVDYNTGNKNAHTILRNAGDYYDLEIDMNSVAYEVKLDAPSPSKINILNNLTITTGWVEKSDASDTLDIFGLTNISANGKFMEDANENTNTITHHGLVTNLGTYKINDGTTVKMNGGIRNMGTITVA